MQSEKKSSFTRRQLLIAGGVGLVALAVPVYLKTTHKSVTLVNQLFLTAHTHKQQSYVSALSFTGEEIFRLETPFSCHSIVSNPGNPSLVIGVARDPKAAALVIDTSTGKIINQLAPGEDSHFNGHGCLSSDGKLFYATENHYVTKQGGIGVYDVVSGERVETLSSFGQGPHELAFLSDQQTLVVANGGIQTHPESGRKPLNIESMRPSLVYIDSVSGQLIRQLALQDHLQSIRHMAIGADDTVCVALQYQGKRENPPVVGFQSGSSPIKLVRAASDKIHWQMNQYTASVSIHPDTGVTAITCPRGNLVTFWDSRSSKYLGEHEIYDASGVALSRDGSTFFVTSGTGKLYQFDAATLKPSTTGLPEWVNAHWGNHFTQLSI